MSIGSVDINIKAVSALNTTYQLKSSAVSSTQCFINDGASDDKAAKCFISSHYYHNGRRRSAILKAAATNQCNHVLIANTYMYFVFNFSHKYCILLVIIAVIL